MQGYHTHCYTSSYLVTNVAIVANAIRHWNDVPSGRDGRVVYGTGLENQRG